MQFPCNSLSLTIAARRLAELYDRAFAPLGITAAQYQLLVVIATAGPLSKEALGRTLLLDLDALNRGLRPLLEAGWVDASGKGRAEERVLAISDSGRAMTASGERCFLLAQHLVDRALGEHVATGMRDLLHDVINASYGIDPAASFEPASLG